MKIQVNSDKTIAVDASLTRYVEGEVGRVLGRFAVRLTRVEIHLSDIDNGKTGKADKRCLIEVRPMGAQPLSASATATKMPSAIGEALGKMQRALTTFFGRKGRPASTIEAPVSRAERCEKDGSGEEDRSPEECRYEGRGEEADKAWLRWPKRPWPKEEGDLPGSTKVLACLGAFGGREVGERKKSDSDVARLVLRRLRRVVDC